MLGIMQDYFDGFLKFLPRVVLAIVIFLVFWFVSNRLKNLIRKKSKLLRIEDALIINFLSSLAKGLVIVVGVAFSLNVLGLSGLASGLITGAGVSAVVLGFGFKNVGENLISGFMLLVSRPFNTGDFISVTDITGTVVSLNLKSTDVRTIDGKMIFIPNALVINNPLTNFTAEGKRRFEFEVYVDVSNDASVCKQLMLKSLDQVPEILKDPIPVATLSELSSNMKLKAFYWLKLTGLDRNILDINSDAIEKCKKAFEEAGIELADTNDLKITKSSISVDLLK